MSELRVKAAAVFAPLRHPARYKGAYGGRGSGKSQFFADEVVKAHLVNAGRRTVCIREVQKSLKESAKRLIEDKIEQYDLSRHGFRATKEFIETPGGGVIIFQGMTDHTAESVKSLEGFDCAWVEEAQSLSRTSLELLRPTIRKPGSELWFSWNPRRPNDPVDEMLRGPMKPTGATVVQANWSDNPWFPAELEQERQDCLNGDPDKYGHIWEGDYQKVYEGAYYADGLNAAEREGRIANVGWDHLYQLRAYWDIGGTSRKSDATAIWICQFVGDEIKVLDYYEAIGQEFSHHAEWLRRSGYENAVQYLPHDGAKHDTVHRITPHSYMMEAGFNVHTMPNIGSGAAIKRIEAVRRVLHKCRFDKDKTQAGRDALAWYHERRDEERNIGLGPEHDWSSHAADAFGQLAISFMQAGDETQFKNPIRRNLQGVA